LSSSASCPGRVGLDQSKLLLTFWQENMEELVEVIDINELVICLHGKHEAVILSSITGGFSTLKVAYRSAQRRSPSCGLLIWSAA